MQTRPSVPAYDLITSSYLDPRTLLPLYDPSTVAAPIQVWPALVNNTLGERVREGGGELGRYAGSAIGHHYWAASAWPAATTCVRTPTIGPDGARLALYWGMPAFAGTGPRHLVLNYGNDIFVLPQAVNLVKRPAPGITSVRTNARWKRDRQRQQLRRRQRGLLRRHTGSAVQRIQPATTCKAP